MSSWIIITILGGIGGLVNALMVDRGFKLPQKSKTSEGSTIIYPGFLGNVLIGGITAIIMWLLYSGGKIGDPVGPSQLGGALLSGVGGGRLLEREIQRFSQREFQKESGEVISEMAGLLEKKEKKGGLKDE